MPNWCKGTLKVRGTKENLTKFILEALQPVGYMGEDLGKLSLNGYGNIHTEKTCWIENTRRGFVDGVEIELSNYEDDEILIGIFDARFAWGIDSSELLATCIKYHVDMKIHAFERGMEFNQVIEIVDGKIVKDEELLFKNYIWDCICPELGG